MGEGKRRRIHNGTGSSADILPSIIPFAEIREVYSPSPAHSPKPPATVVIIQDIHQHYEAQKNIANIIKEIVNRGWKIEDRERQTNNITNLSSIVYPLVIGVEGAVGPFDFFPYRAYSDKQLTQDIADFFMKQGMMGGPEFYGITAPNNSQVRMVGVEDKKLYLANIQAFKDSLPLEKQVKVEVEKRQVEIKVKKEKLFNSELLELDRKREAYHEGNLDLDDYFTTMLQLISPFSKGGKRGIINPHIIHPNPPLKKEGISVNPFEKGKTQASIPLNVSHLVEAYHIEKALNISKLENERSQILEILTKKLSKPTLIDKNKLFSEIEQLENHLESFLAKTKEEKELLQESKYLELVKKLVEFSLPTCALGHPKIYG